MAIVTTAVCLLVNAAVQQDFRMSANDPQIQLAEDAADALTNGASTATVNARLAAIDIERSVAPWIGIYDAAGQPLASSGRLGGAAPSLPAGVFAYARNNGEDRVTWQPRSGVRSAIVVKRADTPQPIFVVAGRSLREVERREEALNCMTLAAWGSTLFIAFTAALLVAKAPSRNAEMSL